MLRRVGERAPLNTLHGQRDAKGAGGQWTFEVPGMASPAVLWGLHLMVCSIADDWVSGRIYGSPSGESRGLPALQARLTFSTLVDGSCPYPDGPVSFTRR